MPLQQPLQPQRIHHLQSSHSLRQVPALRTPHLYVFGYTPILWRVCPTSFHQEPPLRNPVLQEAPCLFPPTDYVRLVSVAPQGNRPHLSYFLTDSHQGFCHEPPGAFSSCQPAGQHGSISFFGPLLPRPCLRLGHLHLGLGLRPRCWYILVPSTPPPDHDRSLAPDCYAPEPRPDFRPTTPRAPRFVTISNDTRWYSGSW
jgi:hypothetical protein